MKSIHPVVVLGYPILDDFDPPPLSSTRFQLTLPPEGGEVVLAHEKNYQTAVFLLFQCPEGSMEAGIANTTPGLPQCTSPEGSSPSLRSSCLTALKNAVRSPPMASYSLFLLTPG